MATVRDADQPKSDDRIVQKPLPSGQRCGNGARAHIADRVSDRAKWQRRSDESCRRHDLDTAVVCGSVPARAVCPLRPIPMDPSWVSPVRPRCCLFDPVHRHMAGRPGRVAHSLSEAGWHGHRGVSACCRRVFLDVRRHCHRFASAGTQNCARLSRNWTSGRCAGIAAEQSFALRHISRQRMEGNYQTAGLGCRRARRCSALCARAYARTHEWLPNSRIEHSWIRSAARREHGDKGPSRCRSWVTRGMS